MSYIVYKLTISIMVDIQQETEVVESYCEPFEFVKFGKFIGRS